MFPIKNILQESLRGMKNIFFNSTLSIFLVCLLLVSSFTCFIILPFVFEPTTGLIFLVVLNGVLLFHHWFGMTHSEALRNKPRFGSLVDFILLGGECIGTLYMTQPWKWRIHRYDFTESITLTCAVWVETVCLCLLLMIRFAMIVTNLIREPSTAMAKPFDFFAMSGDKKAIDQMINRLHSGSSFSHARSWFLFIFKSICIFVIVMSLLASLFIDLVLEPIHETAMTPVKLYTTKYIPDSLNIDDINWTIIAYFHDELGEGSTKLYDAIQVKTLSSDATDLPCGQKSGQKATETLDWESFIKSIEVECPSNHDTLYIPDLLITVNFTTLGIDSTSLLDYNYKTVSIVVGLHNNTVDILRNTLPIALVPDAHLLAGVLTTVRYEYKNPKLASLGALSSANKYMTAFVPFLTPDTSSQIPQEGNTATLRLYLQTDLSNVRVSIDYREKSILSGISAIGGFWTVANGLFATIFGTTLWWVLFGGKRLSTFGLIHKIPTFKPVLEDETHSRRYPNLLSEGQSDGGLLDYIKDNFVDLGPFESDEVGNEKDSEKANSALDQTLTQSRLPF